jgi:hypothetical protein
MPEQPLFKDVHFDTDDLADYFAGEMPDEEAAELERHLANCGECRTDASVVGARSQAWISWTSDAPMPARKPAPIFPFKPPKRRAVLRYAWPGISTAAAMILGLLNISLQQKSALQIKELARASAEANSSKQQVLSLNQRIAEVRAQLAVAHIPSNKPGPSPNSGLPLPMSVNAPVVVPLTIQSDVLGSEDSGVQSIPISAQLPPVSFDISLTKIGADTIVDATLIGDDVRIDRTGVPIDRTVRPARAKIALSPTEVKSLVNRQFQVKLTYRGYAAAGSVTIILRLK